METDESVERTATSKDPSRLCSLLWRVDFDRADELYPRERNGGGCLGGRTISVSCRASLALKSSDL